MIAIDEKYLDNAKLFPDFKSHNIRSFQPKDAKSHPDRSAIRYHYTSSNALMAILKTNQKGTGFVRFTDSRYMNDRSEHLFFIKRLLEYLEKKRNTYPFCQEVVNELLLKKHTVDEYTSLAVANIEETEFDSFLFTNSRHFLFCLSKQDDSLHMWNYYVHNGSYQGYNIGIRIYDFLKNFDDGEISGKKSPITFYCGDVLYSQAKQDEEIESLCSTIESYGTKYDGDTLTLHIGMGFLWTYIECYGLFFKDESFSNEKEYRIVIQYAEPVVGKSVSSFFCANNPTNIEYSFFERNGVLVPCLSVPLAKNAVKRITMAPILESQIASISVNEYLEANGYSKVEVRQSTIPIRY